MITPMAGALIVLLLLLILALNHFHRDSRYQDFDLTDLVVHNGRVDKFAFCFMVAFLMMTWMVIYMVVNKTITEGYLTIYAGSWVGPITAKVIWGKRAPRPDKPEEPAP